LSCANTISVTLVEQNQVGGAPWEPGAGRLRQWDGSINAREAAMIRACAWLDRIHHDIFTGTARASSQLRLQQHHCAWCARVGLCDHRLRGSVALSVIHTQRTDDLEGILVALDVGDPES